MPPKRVWFWGRFGLKTGIDFAHFCLESGMVFEESTGAYERIYNSNNSSSNNNNNNNNNKFI